MWSMPSYDPNSFSDGISHLEWNMLSENDHVPLMNQLLQGLYPPGSTVKPMNALALLRSGIDPHLTLFFRGAIPFGPGLFHFLYLPCPVPSLFPPPFPPFCSLFFFLSLSISSFSVSFFFFFF